MEVPTRSASSDEEEIEWGAALPPLSPPRVAFCLPQGTTPLLIGPSVGERRLKHLRAKCGPPSDLSR
jgi:hypothetical protein